jgi:hypothetical protein
MEERIRSDIKIGEFLVKIGALSEEQVKIVLAEQKQDPEKLFGVIALELGFIDYAAITRYIKTILNSK